MSIDIQTYARKGLEAELARLDAERGRVLSLLASLKAGPAQAAGDDEPAPAKRARQMSEAGRQAIREAVQRRWERVRAAGAADAQEEGSGSKAASNAAAGHPVSPKRSHRTPQTGNRKK